MNWVEICNRLFELINESGPNYFSGSRFINIVKEINPYFPDYMQYIEQRRRENRSTSRKDYYRDILMFFDEEKRVLLIKRILQQTQTHNPNKTSELKTILSGEVIAPTANIPESIWNADRLNGYLEDIDASITTDDHERAITLSYTCLEGFFKAFIEHNIPDKTHIIEIIAMAREIQRYLKDTIPAYPDEALKLLNHIAHTVDRTSVVSLK